MTTAYFVNPDVICSTGRSQSEFDVEGTGNTLLFLKEQDLIAVPLDVDSTDGSVNSLNFMSLKLSLFGTLKLAAILQHCNFYFWKAYSNVVSAYFIQTCIIVPSGKTSKYYAIST